MLSVVRLREDYSAEELRTHAGRRTSVQSRHLLSLAAVRDGMDRAAVAKIGSMDRQTLRDWVHRFNASDVIDNRMEMQQGVGGALALEMRPLNFFRSPTFCRDLKVAVSGRGTGRAVRNYKDVSPNWS